MGEKASGRESAAEAFLRYRNIRKTAPEFLHSGVLAAATAVRQWRACYTGALWVGGSCKEAVTILKV